MWGPTCVEATGPGLGTCAARQRQQNVVGRFVLAYLLHEAVAKRPWRCQVVTRRLILDDWRHSDIYIMHMIVPKEAS